MEVLLYTILTLCALGVLAAVILYFVAQKFRVEEDPRIDEVEKMLPGANCGGCGFAGCRGMADALVARDDISALFCPVGGGDCMKAIAGYLGKAAAEKEPQTATVRCGGTCAKRPRINTFDGAKSCAVASSLYAGQTACSFGCLRGFILVQHFSLISGKLLNIFIFIQKVRQTPRGKKQLHVKIAASLISKLNLPFHGGGLLVL